MNEDNDEDDAAAPIASVAPVAADVLASMITKVMKSKSF